MLKDSPRIDISRGASMNRSVIRHLAIAARVAYPVSALGEGQEHDVKGKWVEKDLGFDIRGQDGRRFWGVTTLSGGGEKTDEPFIGELTGKDYRSFVFADTDGFWNGQLDGDDTLSFCYMHTHSRSTVVSCSQVKRTR